jgi:RNA-directed DNA polymerase
MMPEEKPEEPTLEGALEQQNILEATRAVKANRGAAGVDGMGVGELEVHLRKHWETIKSKLQKGSYVPAAVKTVTIPKANGGERTLGIPIVLDRMIQQAIHQQMSPFFEADFSENSFGFRPGRSAHDAVRKAQSYIQAGKKWVVDIDLKNFFDQINHDKLMSYVAMKTGDKALLRMIGKYLRAPQRQADGTQSKRTKGTPQGGPLSPLLANIYLDPLDKEMEQRGYAFVRYADDIAIFASSQRSAQRIYESIVNWLERNLKIEVNREKSGSGPSEESSLLGFRLYEDGRIGVAPKSIGKLKAKVRELWEARQSLTSEQLRSQWQQYICGWWNYFKFADWRREVQNLSGWIRRHMRKCFWLRWKTLKGRYNALKRLGVKGRSLGNASSGKGAWAMARHPVLHQALKNKTLEEHGLIIPWQIAETRK